MAWFHKRDTDQVQDKRPGIIQEQLDRHLQDHLTGVVKFDCPNCKHETLAIKEKAIDTSFPTGYLLLGTTTAWAESTYLARANSRCIVCGKAFRRTDKPSYEEVGENDAH